MLRTTIQTRDETTGVELPISADLREKVRRATEFLESELREVAEKFEIELRWWFVPESGGDLRPGFDLTTPNVSGNKDIGVVACSFDAGELKDDDSMRRALRQPLWHFSRALSGVLKEELARIRRDLTALATVGEE
ncbi:hypothetical protein GobsT_63250 [Gemmata obscuriglobus]|uniref:Uncharacterized protein n=1 Tax=Gemmata obscuriglobus TaxID=114 RepID=A0A2Z3H4L5_9BACT|nr:MULTISPECIES: hypothetical protein [Gemmata]AWM35940.1 hypothetical protein C1280_02200 [Gemmata obscuriglobus]MDY3556862.1 hypothetical protein [Gemmata algarum]QEG31503.1 hypothetical protein GobsT_63250 [Gemmata obscuriglobus]VTS10845.1 unnamed protein product [Gemmata obscuriglobus UQM 2246]